MSLRCEHVSMPSDKDLFFFQFRRVSPSSAIVLASSLKCRESLGMRKKVQKGLPPSEGTTILTAKQNSVQFVINEKLLILLLC